ncbi:hypothetical protein CHARACLAT_008419 [Characodon lateralis]|uniref:Uncharacterized protein n=1 Tax=Characodon lateralis TaxID=208331 RepID=A0ABU7CWH6_9TELE|nr:hypothetical protein [Characodon lateralis]
MLLFLAFRYTASQSEDGDRDVGSLSWGDNIQRHWSGKREAAGEQRLSGEMISRSTSNSNRLPPGFHVMTEWNQRQNRENELMIVCKYLCMCDFLRTGQLQHFFSCLQHMHEEHIIIVDVIF